MSRPSLLKLSEELRPYIRDSVDSRKHENGSVQARTQGGGVRRVRSQPPPPPKGQKRSAWKELVRLKNVKL